MECLNLPERGKLVTKSFIEEIILELTLNVSQCLSEV